jgi:phosphatidate cytidylyltransferase
MRWSASPAMAHDAKGMPVSGSEPPMRHATVTTTADGSAGSSLTWLAALGKRVLSAAVLIPLVIALVWFGGWVAFAGALLTLLLAMWELWRMFAHKGWHPPLALSAAVSIAFLVAATLWHTGVAVGTLALLVGLSISALLIASIGWLMLSRRSITGSLRDWTLAVASAFYLGWPLAFFLLLRGMTPGGHSAGFGWLLALFFMVWATDTFALLVGHYFGRHKLAPHISPAKTWEGFVGGLVFTVIAALVFLLLVPAVFTINVHVPWYHAIAIGVLVGVVGPIGDLAESLLKRTTGVKDSGTIVPGHGGILDRMDSLLFAVLVVFFYAAFLGAVSV